MIAPEISNTQTVRNVYIIVPPPQTMNELYERKNIHAGLNCMDWYLCYRE